jgi:hypothetical protein
VEILVSDKINDKELLGIFANSFHLSNYEFTRKTDILSKAAEEKKQDTEEKDERTKKFTKKIGNYSIYNPKIEELGKDVDYKFWLASAKATEYCRNLANTRGTEANP